ncbi:hypothetical protein BMR07_04285 [Methylococcaceae bacterium CS1]|nr:hypothetical protein [Methyloprofundus sp.]TXK96535.1 hypothetical protein BMR10_07485 [Methylococcaceae bacterium CS4]TXK98941.1 hypothetical protein BMR11_07445 [Methylococcaceae bacterium CS5]TXL06840.1 hypothetical protein BMR09_06980 [Methylococcaceae bacterium CS3]TXL07568.1 hypothetical protein BMR07_04285 [Methylococcaceae bacterium CS1]TXL11408.1 hypothetical protein BMR08_04325 [Methylococcaceae bacterium CS2]
MSLLFPELRSLFLQKKQGSTSLASDLLQGHDSTSKHDALEAIDILVRYKTTVHDFTDEIIEFWPLPRLIMQRYQFDDAEQLNEWLDTFA